MTLAKSLWQPAILMGNRSPEKLKCPTGKERNGVTLHGGSDLSFALHMPLVRKLLGSPARLPPSPLLLLDTSALPLVLATDTEI